MTPTKTRTPLLLVGIIALLVVALIVGFSNSDGDQHNNSAIASLKTGTRIGDTAPEIVLQTPEGKEIKLSSMRGKYVLIDFWASWCRPCRVENPNLVAAYNKYSSAKFKQAKGFEIFSVSLDRTKESWLNAIKSDQLTWKYHGCDFNSWSSKIVEVYKFNRIPYNYLINPKGEIIAKNLRGAKLHLEIDKYVKKF